MTTKEVWYITFTTVFKKSLNMNMTTKEVRTLK